jgi:hypothetical protein
MLPPLMILQGVRKIHKDGAKKEPHRRKKMLLERIYTTTIMGILMIALS